MRYWGWLAAAVMLVPLAAQGSVEDEIAELKRQLAVLAARLERMEAQRPELVEEPVEVARSPDGGARERIQIKGDFRYRHDYMDVEGAPTRNRHRIRARIGAFARVRDDMEVGLQLASGSSSPVTTNQSLDTAASTKDIRLDLAYLRWELPLEGLSVTGGKFKNPLQRPAPLAWDSDVNPEGIVVSYAAGDLFATTMAFWTEERSSGDDSLMLGGQIGWRHQFETGPALLLGGGYYRHREIEGRAPLFDADPRGNSVDAQGNYLFEFHQVEAFGEVDLANLELPLTLFGQYVKNTEAGARDRAFALGALWSPLPHWELGYSYRDVEADAMLGVFTDSDFGLGATDASGHVFESSFDITRAVGMKMTYFKSETGEATGSGTDVDRVFLDFQFKY